MDQITLSVLVCTMCAVCVFVYVWFLCVSVFSAYEQCSFKAHFNLYFQLKPFSFIFLHLNEWPCCVPLTLNWQRCGFLASAKNTCAQTHTDSSTWQQTHAFCLGTVGAGNETKCGQADGQVNETATESLAVFDLPPLIQRDHLINWEDGMYIRIARDASLLFPIPNQITPQPPLEHPEGRMFPLCVCVCVCVRQREREKERKRELGC